MIVGLGIDSIEIERFCNWHSKDTKTLLRLFSQDEIAYCQSNNALSAQRFAIRFAAREALFKAISLAIPSHTIPFLTLCRAANIYKTSRGMPYLQIDWKILKAYVNSHDALLHNFHSTISLTHTKILATAIVTLETHYLS